MMNNNIEFSEEGKAILENRELAAYVSYRLSNMTDQEKKSGKVVVELSTGDNITFTLATPSFSRDNEKRNSKSHFQPA